MNKSQRYIKLTARIVAIVRSNSRSPISIAAISRKTGIKQKRVLQICRDADLCINIGISSGGGIHTHTKIGEYTVEDLNAKV